MSYPKSINDLAEEIHAANVAKGWWCRLCGGSGQVWGMPCPECKGVKRNTGELLMLVVTEVAEAMEEVRRGRMDIWYQPIKDGAELPKPEGFPIELADIIIRVLDLAGGYGIDIRSAINIKMAFNATRPYRHGGLLS